MKNHRFLWLRNRTTDNRKCEKARNIKEKRTIEMFSTVSKPPVELRSSRRDKRVAAFIPLELRRTAAQHAVLRAYKRAAGAFALRLDSSRSADF